MILWLIALAVLAVGLLLAYAGKAARRSRGLTDARTVDLDDRNLYSARLGLTGRPDRVLEGGIPEEWKSGDRVHDSHKAQMAVYFLLIEDETGVAPPYGVLSLGSGEKVRIENTPDLREWAMGIAEQIRQARRQIRQEIEVSQPPGKCRSCSVREWCEQRSA